jgi:hypothetical protein
MVGGRQAPAARRGCWALRGGLGAAERRLLPRPFKQAMERRLRALARKERSCVKIL